jgi:hypothetical protein
MADQRLTDKTTLNEEPSNVDIFEVVDVSDKSDSARGSTKQVTKANLLAGIPTYQEFVTGNSVLKGDIMHTSLLIYYVWAKKWLINNTVSVGALTATKTLSAAHATLNRFDSFIVRDTAGVFSLEVLEGTPAATASIPVPDFTTEAVIATVYIPATATVDPNVVTELCYNEDTGDPTEWDIDDTITGQNLSNSTSPYLDTVSASFPAVATSDVVSWTNTALYTINTDAKVNFALKVPALLASTSRIQVKLINQSSSNYWLINLSPNNIEDYGYDTTGTGWQLVSIPVSSFQTSSSNETQADKIEFTFTKTPILWMDWINIQSGISQPTEPLSQINNTIKKTVTAAQLKTLSSSPIDIIPAPGVGKMISVLRCVAVLKWGSVAFDNNPIILKPNGAFSIWVMTTFLSATANSKKMFRADPNASTTSELLENTKMILTGTDSVATGDSEVDIFVNYEIIEL